MKAHFYIIFLTFITGRGAAAQQPDHVSVWFCQQGLHQIQLETKYGNEKKYVIGKNSLPLPPDPPSPCLRQTL